MQIIIPDDYQDAVRGLACFSKLAGHDVTIFNDTVRDLDALAERFAPADALVLIRERTPIREELLARLPRLKLISQTGKGTAHIDLAACARRGITVAAGTGSPYAPAELTWALVLAAMRRIRRRPPACAPDTGSRRSAPACAAAPWASGATARSAPLSRATEKPSA